jgi:hypothetical protein
LFSIYIYLLKIGLLHEYKIIFRLKSQNIHNKISRQTLKIVYSNNFEPSRGWRGATLLRQDISNLYLAFKADYIHFIMWMIGNAFEGIKATWPHSFPFIHEGLIYRVDQKWLFFFQTFHESAMLSKFH